MRIGIQGGHLSFHDVAARSFFENQNVEIVECRSFRELAKQLKNKDIDRAVMAIENTIAGSLLENYKLIQSNKFNVIGEISLRIRMYLMANSGVQLNDITLVQSHPVALMQCDKFLSEFPLVHREEISDTANGARRLYESGNKSTAVIASKAAAKHYGLHILAEEIETNKNNFTRFLILEHASVENATEENKASLSFELKSEVGSLAEVLSIFKDHNVNLTKIQSLPIIGKPFEYSFYVDMIWKTFTEFESAVQRIKAQVQQLHLFGCYKIGRTIET